MKEESGVAQVLIVRTVGKYGQVTVHYTTEMITATEGIDYIASSGDLTMPDSVGEMLLNVTIRDDFEMEPAETFRIILSNVTGRIHCEVNYACCFHLSKDTNLYK